MCEAIEEIRNDALAEGKAEGKAEGIEEGIIRTLIGLVKKNLLTVTQAAEEAHMTVPEFEKKTGLKA